MTMTAKISVCTVAYESDSVLERCSREVSRCEQLDSYLTELLKLANWDGSPAMSGGSQQELEQALEVQCSVYVCEYRS
jgi:hypothetical protein